MQTNDIYCDEDGGMHDNRVLSGDPHDWDAVEDLNFTYIGYYDLPDFYLMVRENLDRNNSDFFIDGMFIKANPGDAPADVYLRYEERKKTDPVYKQWETVGANLRPVFVQRNDWKHKIKNPNSSYYYNSVTDATKQIRQRFMDFLQGTIGTNLYKNKNNVSRDELYNAYKNVICNSREIQERVSFAHLLSDIDFVIDAANWVHAPKIARATKNPKLIETLKEYRINKTQKYKVAQSAKWYAEYREYERAIKQINPDNVCHLSLATFFQDIEGGESIDRAEKFLVQRKDLFNPMSRFYVNQLIDAALNKDWATQAWTIKEHLTIIDADNSYRIVFGYGFDKEKQTWNLPDKKPVLSEDSVYSMADRGFVHMADWHKSLRRQVIGKMK